MKLLYPFLVKMKKTSILYFLRNLNFFQIRNEICSWASDRLLMDYFFIRLKIKILTYLTYFAFSYIEIFLQSIQILK